LLLPKHRSWLVPVLSVYVLANGFSRPILGMHYPSDVLAGWGLGAGLVAFLLATCAPQPSLPSRAKSRRRG
jgi:membrane-associated phospholipid phosphatase